MRTLFIAVGRVFGLLQVYYGLAYVTSMLPAISMMQRATNGPTGEVTARTFSGTSIALTTGSMVATLVLTFGVAWLLLFRTDWLADKLKVPEQEAQAPLGLLYESGVYVRKATCLTPGGLPVVRED